MRTIKINTECDAYTLYPNEWKGYVYAPEDEFDEVFVITKWDFGRKSGITSASWYQKALEYIEENDLEETEDEIMKALKKLYPDDEFKTMTIRGYVQREYANVIYKASAAEKWDDNLEDTLADFYFGHVTEIFDDEDGCVTYVADSEMWKHEHDDDLKEFICDLVGIDPDEEVRFLKSHGYVTIKNWVEM